jgi:hypothetical protein
MSAVKWLRFRIPSPPFGLAFLRLINLVRREENYFPLPLRAIKRIGSRPTSPSLRRREYRLKKNGRGRRIGSEVYLLNLYRNHFDKLTALLSATSLLVSADGCLSGVSSLSEQEKRLRRVNPKRLLDLFSCLLRAAVLPFPMHS